MNDYPNYFAVEWWFPATRFTHAITIERKVFRTREERTEYIINRKKKWWQYLPFIEQIYYVG